MRKSRIPAKPATSYYGHVIYRHSAGGKLFFTIGKTGRKRYSSIASAEHEIDLRRKQSGKF